MEEKKLNWYALKVFYNKVFEFEKEFEKTDLETYIPVELVRLKGLDHMRAARRLATPDDRRDDRQFVRQGPMIFKRKPVVSSLMFVHAEEKDLNTIHLLLKDLKDRGLNAFIYRREDKDRTPAVIPDKEMSMFRLVLSKGDGGLQFFADDDITRYRQGDRVRVTEGPLAGAEGYIKRIKRDRKLLVAIEGFVAVAVSYIPPQFLEVIEEK